MSEFETYDSWEEMPTTMQVQAVQYNVQRIGIVQTLKRAITGDLEPEDLLEV